MDRLPVNFVGSCSPKNLNNLPKEEGRYRGRDREGRVSTLAVVLITCSSRSVTWVARSGVNAVPSQTGRLLRI